jgi:tetratricopeptide (TPR) repeat protein
MMRIRAGGRPAIAACARAIASGKYVGHELAELHYNLAFEYRQKGDNDRAIANYNEAIRLNPILRTPVRSIGRCGGSKGSNLGSFILNKTRLFDVKGQTGSTIC